MGDVSRRLASTHGSLQHLNARRLTLELCENFHLHWRNLRVESSLTDALQLLSLTGRATEALLCRLEGKVVHLPLDAICPFNWTHRRSEYGRGWVCGLRDDNATREHEAGVDFWKASMLSGKTPWPIAVRPWYVGGYERPPDVEPRNFFQRLDGFKRFIAHQELGRQTIACLVLRENARGCQNEMAHLFRFPGDGLRDLFADDLFECLGQALLSVGAPEWQRIDENAVELLRNGTIHVHIGDLRLEFSPEEFETFADMLGRALAAMAPPQRWASEACDPRRD